MAACEICGDREPDRHFCPRCGTASPVPPTPPPAGPVAVAPASPPVGPPAPGGVAPSYAPYPPPTSPQAPPAPTGGPRRTDPFAIVSLALAFPGAILVSVVLAVMALRRIRRSGDGGRGLAVASLALSALWAVGLVAVLALITIRAAPRDDTGQVAGNGSVALNDIRVGDCLAGVRDGALTAWVDVVPCGQPHGEQVVAAFDLAPGAFPGVARVTRAAEEGCTARIEPDLADRIAGGELTLRYMYPTASNWPDSRKVRCLIASEGGATTEVFPEQRLPTS